MPKVSKNGILNVIELLSLKQYLHLGEHSYRIYFLKNNFKWNIKNIFFSL